MSTSIEFDRVVFRLEAEAGASMTRRALSEDERLQACADNTRTALYLVFVQAGSNNTISTVRKNGRTYHQMSRDWGMAMIGQEYNVIRRAVEWSREVHSGILRFYGRRNLTPEAYIKAHRQALAEAVPPEESRRTLFGRAIRFTADEDLVLSNRWLCHAQKQGRLRDEPPRYGDGTGSRRDFSLTIGEGHNADADVVALADISYNAKGVLWFSPSSGLEMCLDGIAKHRQIERGVRRRAA
jgi:hypothetical protein